MTVQTDHIVLISHETIGNRMSGPGIRYSNIARALARHIDLTLAIPAQSPEWSEDLSARLTVRRYEHGVWESLKCIVEGSRVVICPPDIVVQFPQLADGPWALAFDDYDPLLSEWLATAALTDRDQQSTGWSVRMQMLMPHLLHGDFFFCASERQRDWMLGVLEVSGRLNPHTYAEDHSLRRLVDVVSTGMPSTPPQRRRSVFRETWPGIAQDDLLVLWGGGLWPWLDPLTAIRAVHIARAGIPRIQLLFPGTRLPNPNMAAFRTLLPEARALVESLGMQEAVHFGDWMPYGDWPDALLDADIALTLHVDSLETRLAFRSRILDYLWAGLPTIATVGDATCDLMQAYGMGRAVPAGDPHAVAAALVELAHLPRPLPGADVERARRELNWDVVVRPLLEFCRNPRIAPDKLALRERVGPPYFIAALDAIRSERKRLEEERNHWKALSDAYANGRIMRVLRWLKTGRANLPS